MFLLKKILSALVLPPAGPLLLSALGLLLLRRHVLRVALLPVLTVAGLSFAYAITGSVLVEYRSKQPEQSVA